MFVKKFLVKCKYKPPGSPLTIHQDSHKSTHDSVQYLPNKTLEWPGTSLEVFSPNRESPKVPRIWETALKQKVLDCDMIVLRRERWAQPEIKHGPHSLIFKYHQEEWKIMNNHKWKRKLDKKFWTKEETS